MDVVLEERLSNVPRKLLVKQVNSKFPLVTPRVPAFLGLLRTAAVTRASMWPRSVELSVSLDGRLRPCQRSETICYLSFSWEQCRTGDWEEQRTKRGAWMVDAQVKKAIRAVVYRFRPVELSVLEAIATACAVGSS